MNILLTNDDGYQAPGINYLKEYFIKRDHNVFVIAPDIERSGASHSITFKDTIRQVKHENNLWVLKGTPADCVMTGLLGIIEEEVDLVVAGINHGPNIGKDIIYSGTAAAAREGCKSNITSIALSINSSEYDVDLRAVEDFLDKYLNKLIVSSKKNFFYNINLPGISSEKVKGVQVTIPSSNHCYNSKLVCFDSPGQGRYYWIDGKIPNYNLEDGTDAKAIREGYVSVSLIKILPEAVFFDW